MRNPSFAVLASLALGCGASAPRGPVDAPIAGPKRAPALDVATEPKRAPSEAPFTLALTNTRPCILRAGKLECLADDEPRGAEKALAAETSLRAITSGQDFFCVTRRDGHVACGGGNHFGQLGAGIAADRADLTVVPNLDHVKKVVAGPFTSCAITETGTVACWGKNDSGETGSATNVLPDARVVVVPEVVAGLADVDEVAISWGSACAATTKGEVACWGATMLASHAASRGKQHEEPFVVAALAGATSLSANEQEFCAVRNEKVVCWGRGIMLSSPNGEPTELAIPSARAVSLGHVHGCAVTTRGDVYCFGASYSGALGVDDGSRALSARGPVKVPGLPPVEEIACGTSMSCARTASQEVYCWGRVGARVTPPSRVRLPPSP